VLKGLKERQALIFFCFVSIAFSLYYVFAFSPPLLTTTGYEYSDIARHLAEGKGYSGTGFFRLHEGPTAFLAPAYSYLLAMLIKIFGFLPGHRAMQILQAMLNGLSCGMIYLVAKRIFNKEAALVSAAIFSVYLPFIYWSIHIWDTLLFSAVLLGIIFSLLNYKPGQYLKALLSGGLLGFGALINPVLLGIVPFIALYLLFKFSSSWRKNLFGIIIMLIMLLLMILPWTVRNHHVFNKIIPVRTGFWLNLYLGNNPDATGTIFLKYKGDVFPNYDDGITVHFLGNMASEIKQLNEYDLDQLFKVKYFDYLRRYPLEFIKLNLKKIYYFWWFNPFEKNNLLWVFEYAAILLFSLFGLYRAGREGKEVLLLLLLFLSFTLIYSLSGPFFNWKYRLPMEPYLMILAGYGIYKLKKS